ncbi:MAG TPA: tetratricopeptide repeat protein [Gemmatimonadales bacterium]|nr:tetratricopeptide repeat protein [Gemmatimonadales bacterium]
MPRSNRWFRLSASAVCAVLVAACGLREGPPNGDSGAVEAAKIPVSTGSADARRDYLEGRALAEKLRFRQARERFERAAGEDSTFAMAHYSLALNAASPNDFFAHLGHAVALADKASEGERLLIQALEAGANADPARQRQYYLQLVTSYPEDERAHLLLATADFARQDYASAAEQLRKSVQIAPDFAPAYNLLGYAYIPMRRYADAEKAFRKYIQLIPKDPNPYDSYAELLMKTGRYPESIVQYRKALAADSTFMNSYVGVATNFMYLGQPDSAIATTKQLERVADDNGGRRLATFSRAVTYADQGKLDRAQRELEAQRALAEHDHDPALIANDAAAIGDVLLEAGRPKDALRRYEEAATALQQSDLSQEVKDDAGLVLRYNRARVAIATKDLAAAKAEADSFMAGAAAKNNDGEMRQAHELRGTIALAEQHYEVALDELGRGNQLDAYNLYRQGLAYRAKGDVTKAKEMFTAAANLNGLPTLNAAFVRAKAKRAAA